MILSIMAIWSLKFDLALPDIAIVSFKASTVPVIHVGPFMVIRRAMRFVRILMQLLSTFCMFLRRSRLLFVIYAIMLKKI